MSKYFYGFKKGTEDPRDFKFEEYFDKLEDFSLESVLPNVIDIRKLFNFPVLDQGQLGSCSANSTSNALRYLLHKEHSQEFQPSRLFIYYYSRLLEGTVDQDSGAELRDVMKAVKTHSACSEEILPYDITKFTQAPTPAAIAQANQHLKNITYLSVQQNLNSIKTALSKGFPIVFGVQVYSSFESDNSIKTGCIPMPDTTSETLLGAHAILLVACDDNTKTFTFLNSWGSDVGVKGYFTIPYSYVLNPDLASDFWILTYFK